MALLISKKKNGIDTYCSVIKVEGENKVIFDSNPEFAISFNNEKQVNDFLADNAIEDYIIYNKKDLPLYYLSINNGLLLIDGNKDINGEYLTTVFTNRAKEFTSPDDAELYAIRHNIFNFKILVKVN